MAECTLVIFRSFEHHTGDSTFWLDSITILRDNTLVEVRGLLLSSAITNLARGLVVCRLFLDWRKAFSGIQTQFYAQQSAFLTTIPEGWLTELFDAAVVVVVSNPFGAGKPTPSPFDFSA
ncbi:hypothetical protein TNCV_1287521 [Trichonephila clavipes]|nr:hypothetical protein TNCV_1287521 [Trichonephila clavipes]